MRDRLFPRGRQVKIRMHKQLVFVSAIVYVLPGPAK